MLDPAFDKAVTIYGVRSAWDAEVILWFKEVMTATEYCNEQNEKWQKGEFRVVRGHYRED